jgi:hypothetical protein
MPQATVRQTLTPEGQATFEQQQKVEHSLADLAGTGVNTVQNVLSKPFEYAGPDIQTSLAAPGALNYGPTAGQYGLAGGGPAAGQYGQAKGIDAGLYGSAKQNLDLSNVAAMPVNAGMTGQAAIMSRLQPQIAQQGAATAQQLANQGITPGSEAYNNAMRTQGQQENDLYRQAGLYGLEAGQKMQDHYMNLLGAARQQSSPTAPNFAPVPQQQYTAGPDILGATKAGSDYAQNVYNSQVAQYNADGGWFGPIGGAALDIGKSAAAGAAGGWAAGKFSDRRLKKDVQEIGKTDSGLPLYLFRYLWDNENESPRVGVMAQDVLEVMPDAVMTRPDGYLMVDYARI